MTALVFVGTAVFDVIALVDRFPGPDERVLAGDVRVGGGGPSATAAVAASRLGVPAAFVGAVGDDENGERIVAGLAAEEVDVSGVSVVPGVPSAASVGLVDRRRGTRAIATRPGPPPRLNDAAVRLIANATWVHADHAGWKVAREATRSPCTAGFSVDAGNPIEGLELAGTELFVPTLDALQRRYGSDPAPGTDPEAEADSGTPGRLLDAALAEGARIVVATRGSKGCVAATATGERWSVPAYPVEPVSTLGAGDVFHGALLAALVRGDALPEALRYANVTAALSCRALDGRSGIPDHDEVVEALRAAAPAVPKTLTGKEIP